MSKQPNILFIVTDHQAWANHFRPGEFSFELPAWRKFYGEGTQFNRAYSVCPLCTPARSSMMTGLYPTAHGLTRNTDGGGGLRDFRQGQQLYSHHLSQAGYRNAYFGKWHCGHERLPIDYGIEGWSLPDYGKVYMSPEYAAYAKALGVGPATARIEYNLDNPEWAGQTKVLHHESPWYFMNGSGVLEGPPAAHEEQFVAHLATEKLKELAKLDQPFSLVASFWGPHQPYYPSEPFASAIDPRSIPEFPSFRDDLRGRPQRHLLHRECHHTGAKKLRAWSDWQKILARAYGQQLQTDAAIGSLLETLDSLGLKDNTVVIWCADHGDSVASHGGLWDKACTMTEEVMRVPLAIRWPAALRPGVQCDRPVSNMDVTATMLEAAGVRIPPELHSRSLLPLCRDPRAPGFDELLCQHHGHGGTTVVQRMLIRGKYKYVAALYDGDELYDLESDPYEVHNLAGDNAYAEIAAELRGRIRQQMLQHEQRPRLTGEAARLMAVLTNAS